MSEREKTNKQNQVDQLNRGLLNMLDGTANPAGRTQTNGSVDKESDIFDDIFRDFKESSKAAENPTTSNLKLIPKPEPILEPIPEPEPIPDPEP